MADTKVSAMTELLTLGDDDVVYVVDNTTTPGTPISKKMKASVLRTQIMKKIYCAKVTSLVANTPTSISFTNAIGSDTSGQDYALYINNHIADEADGFTISSRTQNGFIITSISNTTAEILAILIN